MSAVWLIVWLLSSAPHIEPWDTWFSFAILVLLFDLFEAFAKND